MSDQVVELSDLGSGVIQIKMQDKVHKNTFTNELLAGLLNAFESVKKMAECKAVILTGYDSYFASGGTKEGLLRLSDGTTNFAAGGNNLYGLALDCSVPVISAMQGHGIGGGFAMGLYSDFVVLSQESVYTTNFMKYGFTPGFGATFILPQKLGISLAEEMMLSAKTYYGEELQKRGIPYPVMPRAEVLRYSIDLAYTLAEKPKTSLITLKDHLVANMRKNLASVIEQEVVMHDKTIHQPEVKENIERLFGN